MLPLGLSRHGTVDTAGLVRASSVGLTEKRVFRVCYSLSASRYHFPVRRVFIGSGCGGSVQLPNDGIAIIHSTNE